MIEHDDGPDHGGREERFAERAAEVDPVLHVQHGEQCDGDGGPTAERFGPAIDARHERERKKPMQQRRRHEGTLAEEEHRRQQQRIGRRVEQMRTAERRRAFGRPEAAGDREIGRTVGRGIPPRADLHQQDDRRQREQRPRPCHNGGGPAIELFGVRGRHANAWLRSRCSPWFDGVWDAAQCRRKPARTAARVAGRRGAWGVGRDDHAVRADRPGPADRSFLSKYESSTAGCVVGQPPDDEHDAEIEATSRFVAVVRRLGPSSFFPR